MSRLAAVAENTLREAIRDRILYLLLFFAVLMIGVSRALSELSIGGPQRIVVDVGLASIGFFSVLIAVVMGIGLISRDIDRRTVYSVVSKPISRETFVVGKFCGMLAAIAINEAVMAVCFGAALRWWGIPFTSAHAMALVLILIETALMLAVALLFSALASPLIASMFTLAFFFVGHWLDGLRLLIVKTPPGPARTLAQAVFYGFPNLELLNLKNQVVFADAEIAARIPEQFRLGLGYGLLYTMAVLVLAALAYRRKDFV